MHQRQRGQQPYPGGCLQPQYPLITLRSLVEPCVQALNALVEIIDEREPLLPLSPHRLAHLQLEELLAPFQTQQPRPPRGAGAEGQSLEAVLSARPYLHQFVAMAQEP